MVKEVLMVKNSEQNDTEIEISVNFDEITFSEQGDINNNPMLSFISLPISDWNEIKNFIDNQQKK